MSPFNLVFDLYAELEVRSDATEATIISSYRRLSLLHHPDKNPANKAATAKMARLNQARDVLTDTTKRRAYDHWRKANKSQSQRASSGAGSSSASNKHANAGKHDSDYGYGYGHNYKQESASSNSDKQDVPSEPSPKLDVLKQKWARAVDHLKYAEAEWKMTENIVRGARRDRDAAEDLRDQEEERSYDWKQANYDLHRKDSELVSAKADAKKAKCDLERAEELVGEAARAWRKAAPCT